MKTFDTVSIKNKLCQSREMAGKGLCFYLNIKYCILKQECDENIYSLCLFFFFNPNNHSGKLFDSHIGEMLFSPFYFGFKNQNPTYKYQ